MSVDHLASALNSLKVHEMVGKSKCKVVATKMLESVLSIFKKEGYISNYKLIDEDGSNYYIIDLCGQINNCGVIKPRSPVKKDEWAKMEQKYIPAIGVGLMVVSTPKGIMTNREVQSLRIGGRLVAYVY